MSEEAEKICVQRFLKWYKKQHKRSYTYERAEKCFPDLKGRLRWEFVAYEPDNPEKWIGIEIKELSTTREVSRWSEFWDKLCLELSQNLADEGIKGEFEIIHPPVLHLKPKARRELKEALVAVITDKWSVFNVDFIDIGPDIANKFANWPREKIKNFAEYNIYHGEYRPSELLINKSPDSRCEVISPISPIIVRDASETHKETFNQADIEHANKQLKLAKEKGARKTILLLACYSFIYEDLIKSPLQDLDRHLISDIDYIYLVDMGSKGSIVNIYPN